MSTGQRNGNYRPPGRSETMGVAPGKGDDEYPEWFVRHFPLLNHQDSFLCIFHATVTHSVKFLCATVSVDSIYLGSARCRCGRDWWVSSESYLEKVRRRVFLAVPAGFAGRQFPRVGADIRHLLAFGSLGHPP